MFRASLVVPGVKTLCFQGWELEYSQAGQGTKISCASQRGQKRKSMFKDFSIYVES